MAKYQNPAIISKQYPTLAEMQSALKLADTADPLTRDARPLFSILERIAAISPRISGHITTRRTGASSFNWKLDGAEDFSEKQALLFNSIKTIIYNHTDASVFGEMLFGLEWVDSLNAGGGIKAKVPKIKRYSPVEYMAISQYEFATLDESGAKTLYSTENNTSFLYYCDNPDTVGGIMRTVLPTEILAKNNINEWSETNQRMKGIISGMIDYQKLNAAILATASDTSKEGEITAKLINDLKTAIEQAGQKSYIIGSDAAKIEMKNLVESSAGASFNLFKTALDNDIAIAFLGQANTAQLPNSGGSRAALQVLNLIRSDILFSDMQRIEEVVNILLDMDYQINLGGAGSAPYRFKWIYDDVIDIEANARMLEIASKLNLSFMTDEIYRKLDMTRPEGTEDVMQFTTASTGFAGSF